MKKTIILSIIMLCNIITFANPIIENKPSCEFLKKPIQVRINITLAKPKSDCQKFPGVCKIDGEPSFQINRFETPEISCGGTLTFENNKFIIELLREDMSEILFERLSNLEKFPIDEPFIIPEEILREIRWERPTPCVIPVCEIPLKKIFNGFQLSLMFEI